MRHLPLFASLFVLTASCVSAPSSGTSASGVAHSSVTITADGKSKLMPSTAASPGFSDLRVDMMTADALMSPNTNVAPGGTSSLGQIAMQNAAASCEVAGCQWHMSDVPISADLQGLMSVVSDSRTSNPVWQTTYAMVVNPNQIQDSARQGLAISGFAPGYVLSRSSVDQLAKLLNTDSNTLVSRGVCLGLVWSTRGEGTGIGTGYANARVSVNSTDGTAPSLYYLDDTMTLLTQTGTNQDGLFVVVGPDLTVAGAQAPSSYKVPLVISNATSAGTFVDSIAIVRPGIITVVPVIPRR